MDKHFYPESSQAGQYTDMWGSTWLVLQEGMIGEVKDPALKDISKVREYKMPVELIESEWQKYGETVDKKLQKLREKDIFIIGGAIEVFQRMQFIRGTENLYYDLGDQSEELLILRDRVVEYFKEYIKYWLDKDVDAIGFYDDWGAQRSTLISPKMWRELFKPVYKELIDIVKKAGKYVFFHTDGYIMELYPEFIELGVDALNSQLWCMDIDAIAEKYAGKITFWGEIDRQHILSSGTPDDVYRAAKTMRDKLFVNGGGLIGQSVTGVDVPLENIEAVLTGWNKV